jgi:hypothetical protein
MNPEINSVLSRIKALPADWHAAGLLPFSALKAIAECAPAAGFARSLETGCGATTLLLSHLSAKHFVFAIQGENRSITSALTSDLLRKGVVELNEGPTQQTLPAWKDDGTLDFVLLDGPHGFPFHHLEYYHVYPRLKEGSWLVMDNIEIPSVNDHYRFLLKDEMFTLEKRVGNTAFFRRTGCPTIDPMSDSWWLQGYNRRQRLVDYSPRGLWRHFVPAPAKRAIKGMLGIR